MSDSKVVMFIIFLVSISYMFYCASKDGYDESDVAICGGVSIISFMGFLYT